MMKISKSILFCLVVCCGFYGLSDGAALPSMVNDAVKDKNEAPNNDKNITMSNNNRTEVNSFLHTILNEVGSTGLSLLSSLDGILGCNSSDSNKIPSSSEITANPIPSLSKSLCYIIKSLQGQEKSVTDMVGQPLETVLPPIMAVLKNIYESNIIPEPLNSLVHTILSLYDINRLLMSAL